MLAAVDPFTLNWGAEERTMVDRDVINRTGGALGGRAPGAARRQAGGIIRSLTLILIVLVMVTLSSAQLATRVALTQDAPTPTPRPLETLRAQGQGKDAEAGIGGQSAPTGTLTATLPITPGVSAPGPGAQEARAEVTHTEQVTDTGGAPELAQTSVLDEVIVTRAPEPTATPDRIEQAVKTMAVRAGLTWTQFLGISVADWINIGVSGFWVLIGYLAGSVLINRILPALAGRTPYEIDDALVKGVGPLVR
jgi:hypothetical protein